MGQSIRNPVVAESAEFREKLRLCTVSDAAGNPDRKLAISGWTCSEIVSYAEWKTTGNAGNVFGVDGNYQRRAL